ncbi:antibiotic biosynthesis monooxygenase [Pseudomonas putida]|uniref:Antibiotic biosynthesis monooxygenase n=1 Tax=Pseudomonas putida (strain W619) TaxID=390235 RepID=B1JA19_PSEPW|nr:putative quinol monooxygenase [Pseudomonas putida]KHL74594.1 antibiotic biosynthesis monooxygenase [Pseudomonas putida]
MKIPTLIGACAVACLTAAQALGEDMQTVVRIAQLEIDPAKLQAYEAAVKEEMAESIRLEPGVLAIYSVAEKDQPNRLHFFEIYASDEAYRSHIASAHFQKYAAVTQSMILSKRLIETTPVQLSAQAGK